MKTKFRFIRLIVTAAVYFCALNAVADQNDELERAWSKVRDGSAIAIMRHALAPGVSDPSGFNISQCSTQRNLSEEGRMQARRIGQVFRDQQLGDVRLYSSQWCRCVDTAELLDIGVVNELPSLNSFFENRERALDQTAQLRQDIDELLASSDKPVVMVSHQVNISALAGSFTASGDTLIVTVHSDEVSVLARISPE